MPLTIADLFTASIVLPFLEVIYLNHIIHSLFRLTFSLGVMHLRYFHVVSWLESHCFLALNTLAAWCEELTHWKSPWCWERLKAKGEGGGRGWEGWMASLTQWTWVWPNSGRWWRTGRPGVLQSTSSQWVEHDFVTEQQQFFQRVILQFKGDNVCKSTLQIEK